MTSERFVLPVLFGFNFWVAWEQSSREELPKQVTRKETACRKIEGRYLENFAGNDSCSVTPDDGSMRLCNCKQNFFPPCLALALNFGV